MTEMKIIQRFSYRRCISGCSTEKTLHKIQIDEGGWFEVTHGRFKVKLCMECGSKHYETYETFTVAS